MSDTMWTVILTTAAGFGGAVLTFIASVLTAKPTAQNALNEGFSALLTRQMAVIEQLNEEISSLREDREKHNAEVVSLRDEIQTLREEMQDLTEHVETLTGVLRAHNITPPARGRRNKESE